MRSLGPRRYRRALSFETLEPRRVLSASPLGFAADALAFEPSTAPEPQAALVEAHAMTGLNEVRAQHDLTGAGQTAVIIDTGVAWDHAALGGGFGANYRIVGGWDFAENDADPYDDGPRGGHGTHVTGILGGGDATYPGVAPGSDLVVLRVFDDNGGSDFRWIEDALDWVHDHLNAFENPITTVNISVQAPWNSERLPSWAMLEDELAQLKAEGVFTTVAAGNNFAQYGEPGLSYPAVSPLVVPVSALDPDGALSSSSQRHDSAIAAPGRWITSTVPDYEGDGNGVADDFGSYSGTSMAAPYVGGASMLIREAMQQAGQTNIDQDAIYAVMRQTADTFHDPATGQSYLSLNLDRAIQSILVTAETDPPPATEQETDVQQDATAPAAQEGVVLVQPDNPAEISDQTTTVEDQPAPPTELTTVQTPHERAVQEMFERFESRMRRSGRLTTSLESRLDQILAALR